MFIERIKKGINMADNFTDTFTKEETIKALRCCYSDEGLCSICPYKDTITSCTQLLKRDAFDIIKGQEQFIESQNELISKLALECKKAKIESYKEFADKLKAKAECEIYTDIDTDGKSLEYKYFYVDIDDIDEVLQEFGCKNNISDEAKVIHGEWVYEDGDVGYNIYRCSKCCQVVILDDEERIYSYCPNCGAKMDGEREDKE